MQPEQNNTTVLAEGKYIRLVRRGRWEYAMRLRICGIVGIVAVTPHGELLLVEQFRPAVGKSVIELPAGLAGDTTDTACEDLAEAARRELLEETGYAAARVTPITEGPPSAGITNEIITLFRAEELHRISDGGGDENEDITVHAIPLPEVHGWLESQHAQGTLIDLRIYTALYFLQCARG